MQIPHLDKLTIEVIDSVTVRELQVQDEQGRWYLLRLRPYKTLDARIDGAVLALIDIDTSKRAREFAESIVATVREPLVVLDHELRIRSASRAFYATFGLSEGGTLNRLLFEIGNGEWNVPALRRKLEQVLDLLTNFEDFEIEMEPSPGVAQVLLVNAQLLLQAPGVEPLILMSIELSTERNKLHESMREVVQLGKADRNKDEFLAMLAHELRNPLAPLQNALHMVRNPAADEAARSRAHEMMERQIRIMTRLVDDLLDSARVTHGKIGLFREPVEIGALLGRIALSAQAAMGRKHQTLTVSVPTTPIYVDADPTRLEQSFGNLLNNASKFTADGGEINLIAEVAFARSAKNTGSELIVRVRDNGTGISPATLPYIFDLFMQSDRALDRPQGGLGIGLTLTRRLLELHGGSIEAHSDGLGHGSEFIVRLPVTAAPEDAHLATGGRIDPVAQAAKREILVVDDNVDAAESLAMLLRTSGHEVSIATTALDGLAKAVKLRPQVIVLDIGLPEMNGFELATKIRGETALKNTMLIALSGYGRDEDRQRGVAAGFDHHFTKPVDYQALCAALEDMELARGL